MPSTFRITTNFFMPKPINYSQPGGLLDFMGTKKLKEQISMVILFLMAQRTVSGRPFFLMQPQ